MHDLLLQGAIFLGGGLANGIITVVALRTDLGWVKKILDQHHDRLNKLEGFLSCQK